jgi:hypothetical protein
MFGSKFDSLRATHQEEEPIELPRPWRRRRPSRSEELPEGESAGHLERLKNDQSSMLLSESPRERFEAHVERELERQPEEHTEEEFEPESEGGPEPTTRSVPPLNAFSQTGNTHRVISTMRRPSLPEVDRDEMIRIPDQQSFKEQFPAYLESQLVQIMTEMRKLEVELAEFVETKKIRPSQWSAMIFLFAMFLLGSRGIDKEKNTALNKMEHEGNDHKYQRSNNELDELRMSGGV